MVTVYTKNNCHQCTAVKRHLDSRGIDAQYLNVEEDEDALDAALATGFKQAPIVVTETGHTFAGYDPLELDKL